MMRLVIVLSLLASLPVAAEPPSGYACSPGTANKGVGCTCPANHREKRDADNVALCAAKPTPNAAQQLIALLEKNNLPAAIEYAKKLDFFNDKKTMQAVMAAFVKVAKPAVDQMALLAARGQCSRVNKILADAEQWLTLFITMGGRSFKGKEYADDAMDVLITTLEEKFEPIRAHRTACLETASKDDGTAQLKPVYEANREAVKKCFAGLPEPKTPLTAKIIVDADGEVAGTTFTVTWPDLDVKLVNHRLEMVRLDEIRVRERCFRDAIASWKLKPNARGFAATLQITK